MADHRNRKSPSQNRVVDPSYDVYDEDPLVELARIVSEEGGYLNISEDRPDRSSANNSAGRDMNYGHVEPEPSPNLESQMLEELEISMARPEEGFDDEHFEGAYEEDDPEFVREQDYSPDDGTAPDPLAAEPFDPHPEQAEYAVDDEENLTGEVSEILSEEELSELEHALAEAGGFEDAEAGAQFDDDMGLAASGSFDEIADEMDEFGDSVYQVPPAIPVNADFDKPESHRGRGPGRKIFAIAAVLSVAVLGGGVLAMMSSTSNKQVASAPPVFKAGDSPLKVAPEPGSDVASNENQSIFDVAATDKAPAREELVERAEKPMDRVIPLNEPRQAEALNATGISEKKDTARLGAETQTGTAAPGAEPIGPKQVTTVKVSADGTIIRPSLDETGPAMQADEEPIIVGGLPAPVKDTNTGAVSANGSQPVPVRVVEVKPTEANTGTVGSTGAGPRTSSPVSDMVGAMPAPGSDAADNAALADNPLPRARPDEVPEVAVARVEPSRNTGLVAQPAPQRSSGPVNLLDSRSGSRRTAAVAAAPANTGSTGAGSGYLVQLSAQRSEDQALAAFNGLKQQYPSLLGDYQPNIQRADLGSRGIYYRVRIGPMASQGAANEFCEQLKSSGGNCFVTR